MNCAYHPTVEAVAACVNCGRLVCAECKVVLGGKIYCNPCADKVFVARPPFEANTSGMGGGVYIPPEATRWNWGAVLLTPIWSIFNHVWIGLLSLIEPLGIIVSIILALKGSEWAWRSKRWDSVEHFKRTQRTWAVWGVVVTIVSFVIMVIGLIVAVMEETKL